MKRFALAFVILVPVGCFHANAPTQPEAPETARRGRSYAAEKTELLYRMDREMNGLIAKYTKRLEDIRTGLEADLAALAPPSQLLSVERAFRGFGAPERERYVATVDHLVAEAVAQTEALVGREKSVGKESMQGEIEAEALRLAAELGGDGLGAGYGFVSGVEEIDERAHVTVEMLRGVGDVPGLKDLGEIRKAECVEMAQLFRHELTEVELAEFAPRLAANVKPADESMLPRVGRFALYQSEALEGFRMKNEDSIGVVVAFQGERLPSGRKWQFIQGQRCRVIRGGVIVRDFGWRLDPTTRNADGRVPFGGTQIDENFMATETMFPGINVDHTDFPDTRDFTLVNDYSTGLVDVETGEWLGSIRWQVRWLVSLPGEVRIIPSVEPSFDAGSLVLRELLASPPGPSGGVREPSPNDLLSTRIEPAVEAEVPRDRDLGNGVMEPLARSRGRDLRTITAAGRKYLAARRYAIATQQVGVAKYYDGNRQRYVMSLTSVPKDSPLRDLGFRVNDDIQSVNMIDVHDFTELWDVLAAHAKDTRFTVDIIRDGALRRLEFDIEGVPADAGNEPVAAEDDTPQNRAILDRLFAGETTAISDAGQ